VQIPAKLRQIWRTEAPQDRLPRGAVIVVAIGLLACVVAAVASTDKSGGTAAQLEWVQKTPLPDSRAVTIPGGGGTVRLAEAGIRDTGTNVSGYSLYRTAATLKISAGAPVGGARVLCSTKAPGGSEVAQTSGSRASYPRSSEKLIEQEVPEVVLVEFSSHGDSLAVVEFEDLFEHGFATEKGIKVEWPAYKVGEERWKWFLPPGPPAQTLELPFATVWRTTAVPSAGIACTLTTSAGKATVRTQGGLSHRSEPIAE
jgi:hypothetical protein